jgi:hypothetical protein
LKTKLKASAGLMAAGAQLWPGVVVVWGGVDVGAVTVSVVALASEPPPLQALKMLRHIAVSAAEQGLNFIIFMVVLLLIKS